MIERIIQELKASGAAAWTVSDVQKDGWEFYFIRHRLDQNRAVETEHITVTVYERTGNGKFLGSASDEAAPTASAEEIRETIAALRQRAALVKNPAYQLREPAQDSVEAGSGIGNAGNQTDQGAQLNKAGSSAGTAVADGEQSPAAAAGDFLRTMTSLPETATEDVNSYEIFTNRIRQRLVTSTGIDVTQTYPSSMLEVVTNAREADGQKTAHAREIELYRMYNGGTCDEAFLKKDIARTLQYGKDRLHTEPTPETGKIPLVLSTADAVQVCQYFIDRMNAQYVYQKLSDWKLGEPVTAGARGDRITVETKTILPNSSQNLTWDAEGARIRDEVLIRNGVAEHYWGNAMFSSYLGLKDTFQVSNYAVSGGTRSEAELRAGRYLEVVEFSDFQVDPMTGDVFGEIRLGYLHDGDRVQRVSGGSVSGSMRDYAKELYLSREQVQYDNALIPAVVKLMNVTVTGAGSR